MKNKNELWEVFYAWRDAQRQKEKPLDETALLIIKELREAMIPYLDEWCLSLTVGCSKFGHDVCVYFPPAGELHTKESIRGGKDGTYILCLLAGEYMSPFEILESMNRLLSIRRHPWMEEIPLPSDKRELLWICEKGGRKDGLEELTSIPEEYQVHTNERHFYGPLSLPLWKRAREHWSQYREFIPAYRWVKLTGLPPDDPEGDGPDNRGSLWRVRD